MTPEQQINYIRRLSSRAPDTRLHDALSRMDIMDKVDEINDMPVIWVLDEAKRLRNNAEV